MQSVGTRYEPKGTAVRDMHASYVSIGVVYLIMLSKTHLQHLQQLDKPLAVKQNYLFGLKSDKLRL